MLGTGMGYICAKNEKVEVHEEETPSDFLWDTPLREEILGNYISATAIIKQTN